MDMRVFTLILVLIAVTSPAILLSLLTKESRKMYFGSSSDFFPITVEQDIINVAGFQELCEATLVAVQGTARAFELWGHVLLIILKPLSKWLVQLYVFLQPHVERAWILFISQDEYNLMMEGGTVLGLLLIWLLKRFIERQNYTARVQRKCQQVRQGISQRWNDFLAGVRQKSLLAARMIPHALLLIPAGLFVYFLPDMAANISKGWALWLASTAYPVASSTAAIRRQDDSAGKKHALMYWVIFSFLAFLNAFREYIPFQAQILSYVTYKEELAFFFVLWLQLPFTRGVELMYRFLLPILQRVSSSIPQVRAPIDAQQSNVILRSLVAMGILSDKQRVAFSDILINGGQVLAGALFLFMPGFLTNIGCIVVGIALPVYASVNAIGRHVATVASGRTAESSDEKRSIFVLSVEGMNQWLKYWIFFFLITFIYDLAGVVFDWAPFWYQCKLLMVLALQLPVIRGAERLWNLCLGGISSIETSVGNTLRSGQRLLQRNNGANPTTERDNSTKSRKTTTRRRKAHRKTQKETTNESSLRDESVEEVRAGCISDAEEEAEEDIEVMEHYEWSELEEDDDSCEDYMVMNGGHQGDRDEVEEQTASLRQQTTLRIQSSATSDSDEQKSTDNSRD